MSKCTGILPDEKIPGPDINADESFTEDFRDRAQNEYQVIQNDYKILGLDSIQERSATSEGSSTRAYLVSHDVGTLPGVQTETDFMRIPDEYYDAWGIPDMEAFDRDFQTYYQTKQQDFHIEGWHTEYRQGVPYGRTLRLCGGRGSEEVQREFVNFEVKTWMYDKWGCLMMDVVDAHLQELLQEIGSDYMVRDVIPTEYHGSPMSFTIVCEQIAAQPKDAEPEQDDHLEVKTFEVEPHMRNRWGRPMMDVVNAHFQEFLNGLETDNQIKRIIPINHFGSTRGYSVQYVVGPQAPQTSEFHSLRIPNHMFDDPIRRRRPKYKDIFNWYINIRAGKETDYLIDDAFFQYTYGTLDNISLRMHMRPRLNAA